MDEHARGAFRNLKSEFVEGILCALSREVKGCRCLRGFRIGFKGDLLEANLGFPYLN